MHFVSLHDEAALALAREHLLSGAVLLVPSETVCALVTLWSNQAGRQRIYDLKHRPEDKRLQMLAASLEQAAACGLQASPRLQKLAEAFWPGPLTLVCPAEGGQSIGLRIPANDFLLDLLQGLGQPLAATSANRSGCPPPATLREALAQLDGEPELVVEDMAASQSGGLSSTVLSLLAEEPQLLRAGPISAEQIRDCLLGEGH